MTRACNWTTRGAGWIHAARDVSAAGVIVALLVLVVLAAPLRADPRPPPSTVGSALRTAPELVGVRTSAAFRALGDQLTRDIGLASTAGSATSVVSAAAIDATTGVLGPIFLARAATLGTAGTVNATVAAQRYTLDSYGGDRPLGAGSPPLLARNPTTGALVGLRMRYDLAVHVDAVALSATYALRDDLDVSLTLPFSHIDLDLDVTAQVVRAARGGRFVRVPAAPVVHGTAMPIDATGVGDVMTRLHWLLPVTTGAVTYGLTLTGIFPTGDAERGLGGGAYLLNLGAAAAAPWTLLGRHGDVTANAVVSFDLHDPTQTRLLYGISASTLLLDDPIVLGGVVEFLGRSQLDPTRAAGATGVLTITSPTQVSVGPALGLDTGQLNYFDLAFGLRMPLGHGLLAFAMAVVALNSAGLRPSGLTPIVGIGGSF